MLSNIEATWAESDGYRWHVDVAWHRISLEWFHSVPRYRPQSHPQGENMRSTASVDASSAQHCIDHQFKCWNTIQSNSILVICSNVVLFTDISPDRRQDCFFFVSSQHGISVFLCRWTLKVDFQSLAIKRGTKTDDKALFSPIILIDQTHDHAALPTRHPLLLRSIR